MEDQTKKPLEILVVEDKENYLKAAKEAAETTKHNIKYAINYEEGLKVLENETKQQTYEYLTRLWGYGITFIENRN